tara:strand:+ start:14993 stop:17887 length:2895 start_codon:yes stop_codon:yes gene_type:complete
MSSKRFVFAVLFSLLIATVPLEHSEESLFEDVREPLQTSGDLEDYELYLDRDRNDEGTELDFTTIEPAGNNLEDSILNNGIKFYTNELLSDLTIHGKSGNTARIFAFMQFETSDNATADVTVKLFAGDSLIEQHTEVIDGPRCGGFFGDCAWAGYQIDLDLDNDGDTISSGDKMRMEISATASCEDSGQGVFSSCNVNLAYGGKIGNGFSRMEFRANALSDSQVKIHEEGDGWSETEVTEWSPTHRIENRKMQFTVDVRDAFGRSDIDSIELYLYTPSRASTTFSKEFGNNELKLDNDGLVGNVTFTYPSGIDSGEYPLELVITDVQGHVIVYDHPEGVTFLEYDVFLNFPPNQIPKLLVAPGQTSSVEFSLLHTGSVASDLRVELELQQSLPSGWSDPNWDSPGGYTLSGGGSSASPLLTIQAPEDLSSIADNYQIIVEAYAYATSGADSGSQVRLVSLAVDVEKVNQFGPPQIDVYEDVEQQKQIFDSDRIDLYNENLSHYIDYDKVGDFYLSISNVGFDDDSYRIRIQEIPVAWSLKFIINGTGTELTEQGIDSLTPVVYQGEKLVLKVEVYPPFERDAVDIGLIRLSVTSDNSVDEVFTTPVAWTVHRTFGIVGEVISDSDGGTLGQIGPVSPGSTVKYNVRITDSSDDAGTTNWVIKNPAALQRNIDNDPGYATWMYEITDIEGNIALVAPLTGGQYFDIEVEITIRQQVEAGMHVVYLQVAEESDGEDDPRYFDLPLTIEVDEEVIPGNLIVEQKSQTTRVGAGQTVEIEYRIDNLNNVEVDVIISVKAPDGWDATLDDGEIIPFTLDAFSSDDFTMQITAPDKVKNGELVEFELTVTPTSYQECTDNLCYIQKPSFTFKTESSGLINSIMSELEDPEPTTVVLLLSVLVLAGFGLYRRGQHKMKAKMYASMVEPTTMQPESDEEVEVDDFAEEEDLSEETDDIELELIDIESIEDES